MIYDYITYILEIGLALWSSTWDLLYNKRTKNLGYPRDATGTRKVGYFSGSGTRKNTRKIPAKIKRYQKGQKTLNW